MLIRNTDDEWEKFGAEDPYFGVLSQDQFHRENLDDEALSDFFERGDQHVDAVLQTIREHVVPDFTPRRVLDFGCGVGRLVIPFARRAEYVLGVDVSASMLAEAWKNCAALGISNAHFVRSDDALSAVEGTFDLVHSYIVFQHIPVRRGMRLLERLLDHLAEGGVGALHFNFARSRKRQAVAFLKSLPLVHNVYNVVQGKSFSAPQMQMNAYDLNAILPALYRRQCRNVHVALRHRSGELSVVLFFQAGTAARF